MLKEATTPRPSAASPWANNPAPVPEAPAAPAYPYASSPVVGAPSSGLPTNPFGDGAKASPFAGPGVNLNPYASPSPDASPYAPTYGSAPTDRRGLPWETQGAGLSSWWQTSQMCLTEPSYAFRIMWRSGGLWSPMLFAICGMGIGFVGQTLWRLPLLFFTVNVQPNAGGQDRLIEGLIEIAAGAVGTLVGATVGLLLYALIHHLFLMLFGGANFGFETTFRVVCYVHGTLAWLNVIPCVGGLIILVMFFVCMIQGLMHAHETTGGRAAAAVFVPIVLFVAVIVGIVATAVAVMQ
jgi:hypothetical protein